MRILKCDRCGKAYENYTDTNNTVGMTTFDANGTAVKSSNWYDLCYGCMSEFKKWLYTSRGGEQ